MAHYDYRRCPCGAIHRVRETCTACIEQKRAQATAQAPKPVPFLEAPKPVPFFDFKAEGQVLRASNRIGVDPEIPADCNCNDCMRWRRRQAEREPRDTTRETVDRWAAACAAVLSEKARARELAQAAGVQWPTDVECRAILDKWAVDAEAKRAKKARVRELAQSTKMPTSFRELLIVLREAPHRLYSAFYDRAEGELSVELDGGENEYIVTHDELHEVQYGYEYNQDELRYLIPVFDMAGLNGIRDSLMRSQRSPLR